MSIHVALNHVTRYRYDRRVSLSPQVVRLRPAPHCRTRILGYSLRVEPAGHFVNWQQDPFANYLARLVFPEPTNEFVVSVDLLAEMAVYNPFDFFLEPSGETFPFRYDAALAHDLAPYLAKGALTPRLAALVESLHTRAQPTIDFLVGVNQRLQHDIGYIVRMEPGVQEPEHTLERGIGSCRDSGWLLVQVLRHLGLAARFVSGYLIQLVADVKSLDGPSGATRDFTDLHAWCEVYLPGAGWIGLDPTSGLMAGEGHIPLACTPEPSSAAPVSGGVDVSEVEFTHTMQVTRLYESPRVTQPYTDVQWQAIVALGDDVDRLLQQHDVRLTMGGEPTFVSVDDRDGAEWNTEALGPHKRERALALLHELYARYSRGGFLHFGQGKWYPGEPLPRWALSIVWRTDGQPCWRDPALFADEPVRHAQKADDAQRFIDALGRRLGVDTRHAQPAYEDAWHYLWREGRLPVDVDPFDSRLDDELERARLRRIFTQRLGQPVGYALPLRRSDAAAGPRWQTGAWSLREGRLVLLPGDSPMGARLPLDALPWAGKDALPQHIERDPFAPREPFASSSETEGEDPGAGVDAVVSERASGSLEPRTALCIEVRNGVLHVFMLPLAAADDYLELLAAIEATAAALALPIVLEGYPPPRDPRLTVLQVTPDPGVIEVNIHPARNWAELVDHAEFLYDAARRCRLSSEKFMLDGRHTGTGGGNHFVLGGATAADSPFLRRPDLLASLLAWWHNHPSLSYLFSGLFIGPTSQAPRLDEARTDQVYEVELALLELERQIAARPEGVPPWLIDRILRNLLVDATGNTHRTEFCIDKLYSPDSPTGRLGLLELRAFEMPPHARMSLAQQLLLRALVAWFWREPYRGQGANRLARWGTTLHDRFLLPTFARIDFDDVIAELGRAGFAFDAAWFAPHFEFRFPLLGNVVVMGVELSLRAALEPWHVLGEEGAAAGAVRYVDSSLERLEVRVAGLDVNRQAVAVNGVALPLQPTGRAGEFAAGVRYRAWQSASALHPTIGVHAPLTFDVVDLRQRRSLGGCRYHVAHPGGRVHDSFPVNAYEAESRRLARFERLGHTPGVIDVKPAPVSGEFAFTLDLRRAG